MNAPSSPADGSPRPHTFKLSLLSQFESVLDMSRKQRHRAFYFTLNEWLGDAAYDFALFQFSDGLQSHDDRKIFRHTLKQNKYQKRLCELCSFRDETMANLLQEKIRDFDQTKGYGDWLEFYIGVLFMENILIYWDTMKGLVSVAMKDWQREQSQLLNTDKALDDKIKGILFLIGLTSTENPFPSSHQASPASHINSITSLDIPQLSSQAESKSITDPKSELSRDNESGQADHDLLASPMPQINRKSRKTPLRTLIARTYLYFIYTWIAYDELISSLSGRLDDHHKCRFILMQLLNQLRRTLGLHYPDLPLPQTSLTLGKKVTPKNIFEDKIYHYLTTHSLDSKELFYLLKSSESNQDHLDEFRRLVLSISIHSKKYSFESDGLSENLNWTVKESGRDPVFTGCFKNLKMWLLEQLPKQALEQVETESLKGAPKRKRESDE